MFKILKITASIIVLTFASYKANAQWDLFSDLLSQLDNTVYNQYFDNLGGLDSTWSVNQVDGNDLLNEHYDLLNNPSPGGALDSSYIFGLDAGLDSLIAELPGFGLPNADADTLIGELEHIQDIFGTNFDSLGGLYGQYQDSLNFDSANWNVVIIDFDDLTEGHLDMLQDTLGMVMDTTFPSNPHNFAGLIGKLFDIKAFPDLELAFGVQDADLKYWNEEYSANSKVIRIGSVPRFDKDVIECNYPVVPIEARWHVQASWNGGERSSPGDATGAREEGDKGGFNPLLFFGDFAMMATPRIGAWGNTSFRIITSLGMEFGTYAPAHRDYRPPFTSFNKGFATGFGPQIGAGFSMTTGQLVIYSLATIAEGDVLRCALPYRYNSKRFEVGMRYGNIINVRCNTGFATWQEHDNRRADINTQVTVGIILAELHH